MFVHELVVSLEQMLHMSPYLQSYNAVARAEFFVSPEQRLRQVAQATAFRMIQEAYKETRHPQLNLRYSDIVAACDVRKNPKGIDVPLSQDFVINMRQIIKRDYKVV